MDRSRRLKLQQWVAKCSTAADFGRAPNYELYPSSTGSWPPFEGAALRRSCRDLAAPEVEADGGRLGARQHGLARYLDPATPTRLATPWKRGPRPMGTRVVVSWDIRNCPKASPSSRELALGGKQEP